MTIIELKMVFFYLFKQKIAAVSFSSAPYLHRVPLHIDIVVLIT
jgi:hypothetical protein